MKIGKQQRDRVANTGFPAFGKAVNEVRSAMSDAFAQRGESWLLWGTGKKTKVTPREAMDEFSTQVREEFLLVRDEIRANANKEKRATRSSTRRDWVEPAAALLLHFASNNANAMIDDPETVSAEPLMQPTCSHIASTGKFAKSFGDVSGGEPDADRVTGSSVGDWLHEVSAAMDRVAHWLPSWPSGVASATSSRSAAKALPRLSDGVSTVRDYWPPAARQNVEARNDVGNAGGPERDVPIRDRLVDIVRGEAAARDIMLPDDCSDAELVEKLWPILRPRRRAELSFEEIAYQDRLARDVLSTIGWAGVTPEGGDLLDEQTCRQIVADMFACLALDEESADAFLTAELLGIVRPESLFEANKAAFRKVLQSAARRHRGLFEANSAAVDNMAEFYAIQATNRYRVGYPGERLARALGRRESLSADEQHAFDTLATRLKTLVSPRVFEGSAPDRLRQTLAARIKARWAIEPDIVSAEQADAVAMEFLDALLPGIETPPSINGARVMEGTQTWASWILANQVLAEAGGASEELGPDDMSALALIADDEVLNGNPAFESLFERLALIWAVNHSETLQRRGVNWNAVARGDPAAQEEAWHVIAHSFGRQRAAYYSEAEAIDDAIEGLVNRHQTFTTRPELARKLLADLGFDPEMRLPVRPVFPDIHDFNEMPVPINPVRLDKSPVAAPQFVTLVNAWLSRDVPGFRTILEDGLGEDVHKLPDLDDRYAETLRAELNEMMKLTPLMHGLIVNGHGPRDTSSQFSVDPHAEGATKADRQQAAKDFIDGCSFTRADRDFLSHSAIRVASEVTLETDDNAWNFFGGTKTRKAISGSTLLEAKQKNTGEVRYFLISQSDRTTIGRFATSIRDTGLDDEDFIGVIPPSEAAKRRSGRVPSAEEEQAYRNQEFRLQQLDLLFGFSDEDRENLRKPDHFDDVRFLPNTDGLPLYYANDRKHRDTLSDAIMRSSIERAFENIRVANYQATQDQEIFDAIKEFALSLIPFYGCVQSIKNGDTANAVFECTIDALSMLPVLYASKGAVVTAKATLKSIAKQAAKTTFKRQVPRIVTNELWKARGPFLKAAGKVGLTFIKELPPIDVSDIVNTASHIKLASGRMLRKVTKHWQRRAQRLQMLARSMESSNAALWKAVARGYDVADGGLLKGRVAGADAEILVKSIPGTDNFAMVSNPSGMIGPEMVRTSSGQFRPIAKAELPGRPAADGGLTFQVTDRQYRDGAGDAMRSADVESWPRLTPRDDPDAMIVSIDGNFYRLKHDKLGRMTTTEVSRLITRPPSERGTQWNAILDENGSLRLSPCLSRVKRAPGQGTNCGGPAPVNKMSLVKCLDGLVPNQDGLFKHERKQYIKLENRYYRVEDRRGGTVIVHSSNANGVGYPVKYDKGAGKWFFSDSLTPRRHRSVLKAGPLTDLPTFKFGDRDESMRVVDELKAKLVARDPEISGRIDRRNIAFAEFEADGFKEKVCAVSGNDDHGCVPTMATEHYDAMFINSLRNRDTEFKIINYLTDLLYNKRQGLGMVNEGVKGYITMFSQRAVCPSCESVIKSFAKKFPNVKVRVRDGDDGLIRLN